MIIAGNDIYISEFLAKSFGRERTSFKDKLDDLERLLSSGGSRGPDRTNGEAGTYLSTSINLAGLKCQGCVSIINSIISKQPGVNPSSVTVSLIPPRLYLEHCQEIIGVNRIEQILRDKGYVATKSKSSRLLTAKSRNDEILHADAEDDADFSNVVFVIKSPPSGSSGLDGVLGTVDGVLSCRFDDNNRLHVDYNPNVTKKRELLKIINGFGACAIVEEQIADSEPHSSYEVAARDEFAKLMLGLVLCAPVLLFGMGGMALAPQNPIIRFSERTLAFGITAGDYVVLLASTACQILLGRTFYVNAYKSLFYRRSLDMDVLIVVGTSVSYLYFIIGLFLREKGSLAGKHSNFVETSVMIIVLIVLGRYLEAVACVRMSSSVKKLADLSPTATVLVEEVSPGNTVETSMLTDLIEIGDLCKIYREQSFPCDGIVHSGTTLVDESSITGESRLVYKGPGDSVTCGTVNIKSGIIVKAQKVGDRTALSRIIRLIEQAQNSQANIQTFANRICRYFLPTVMGLSLLTFGCWYTYLLRYGLKGAPSEYSPLELSIMFSVSVLVVACPCAIGLAMPTASVIGTGLCAKYGILAKGGSLVYEIASKIRVIAFDKTKTLTAGTIQTKNYMFLVREDTICSGEVATDNICAADLFSALSRIAQESTHPTSHSMKALADWSLEGIRNMLPDSIRKIDVYDIHQEHGKGIRAVMFIPGTNCPCTILVGNQPWIRENVDIRSSPPREFIECEKQWREEGDTIVYIGAAAATENHGSEGSPSPGRLLGAISFSDIVRPESRDVVSKLRAIGISSYIITGDTSESASRIAKKVGIPEDHVFSEASPEKKADIINYLKVAYSSTSSTPTVAMVGDGINDSVALARADLGIAIGAGSEIAIDCARVILMKSDLNDIVIFYRLAKKIYSRIKFNFFWAFAYNIVSIPIAMGLLYQSHGLLLQPPLAAMMMMLSSLSVIISSMLLQLYRPT